MAQWIVDPGDAGTRLDKFLAASDRLRSRARAFDAIAHGKVFVNAREAEAADAGARLAGGDVVRVWVDRPGSARRKAALGADRDLPIVFEDDALVVLNKPAGVLAVPLERRSDARSVYEDLAAYLRLRRASRPWVVHRIDRDTSGLVVFAKHARAREQLKEQFKRREPTRVYLAVVYGHPTPAAGTWRDQLVWDQKALVQKQTHPRDPRGKEAVAQYKVIERLRDTALLEITLVTGRRNQIRLQARLRGHTLVGEKRYTYGPDALRPIDFPRQALHAHRLQFRHPSTAKPLAFEVPLPADMQQLIARLRRADNRGGPSR